MAQTIELSIMRCSMNNKRCVFPNCHGKNSLIHVSKSKRYQIVNSHRIYIPNNSVVCEDHIDDEKWKDCISLVFKYTSAYIEDMVDLLRNPKQCERDSFFSPKKIKENTGLSSTHFNDLFNDLPTLCRFIPKNIRKAKLSLLMYLTRLRRGDRYNRIYEAFNVGQKAGRQYIAKCRIALETDFVPRNIGLNAISREELLQSITNMANGLFLNDKTVPIFFAKKHRISQCKNSSIVRTKNDIYSNQWSW